MSAPKPLSKLPTFSENELANVIIETPKGSRNKLAYEKEFQTFSLKSVLPEGAVFPYDFGFLPCTKGQDGDPLDVLVLMDQPTHPGCLVRSRIIGIIEAEQTSKGKKERNDRIVAVADEAHADADLKSLSDLSERRLEELQHFFISYNEIKGEKFKVLGVYGPARALKSIEQGRTNGNGRKR
jgi:inorganic pyrophosphatase